jgi:hypothetical protein
MNISSTYRSFLSILMKYKKEVSKMTTRKVLSIAVCLAGMMLLNSLALADVTDLVWSTFIGGSLNDDGYDIAIDNSGNIYVTGWTTSSNFPTTAGAFDITFGGPEDDAFVAKLNQYGNTLVYGAYLGGSGRDGGYSIVVDDSGSAYVTGQTNSSDFPTTAGAYDETHNGTWDAYATKISPQGTNLVYSTFLGGEEVDMGFSIAVDNLGKAYVTGRTHSTDYPTTGSAYDTGYNGGRDVFITKVSADGASLEYSTFLGGSNAEDGWGINVGASGNAYVTGSTESGNFPTTPDAFDKTHAGNNDIFVAKLNTTGSDLDYATFLGGNQNDIGREVDIDDSGSAYVTGKTSSPDYPITAGVYDETFNGLWDIYVTKLNPTGSSLEFSTYLGDVENDEGHGIMLDDDGNVVIGGWTRSPNFPTTYAAYDTSFNGEYDAIVAMFNPTGTSLDYSTFLGNSADDQGFDITVDGDGFAYLVGQTWSANFPTTSGAFDETYNGYLETFVSKLNYSGSPVPVILASFEAIGGQGVITLKWVTASEVNCHSWEIYRSELEYGDYTKVGEKPGHGSTEIAYTYQWIDHQVLPNNVYFYTLKQVDFDGSFHWSNVVFATADPAVPEGFALHQNYPNPFNPATEIKYIVSERSKVTLKVYNILGEEITTLVDEVQDAQSYNILWDAKESASGVYFCTITAGSFQKTVKMILLK